MIWYQEQFVEKHSSSKPSWPTLPLNNIKQRKVCPDFVLYCSHLFIPLPSKMAKILRLGKKKNEFFCFALDFSYLCNIITKNDKQRWK